MATVSNLARNPKATAAMDEGLWLREHINAGMREPHAVVTMLTPALASRLLSRNPSNRRMTAINFNDITGAIQRGDWMLNGETIIVSKDGLLNDGQTRCAAVVETDKAIPATIFFGAERDSRKTVDLGAKRTAAHFLGMDGEENPTQRAAIARWLLAYEGSEETSVLTAHGFGALELYRRAAGDEAIGSAARYIEENGKLLRGMCPPSVIGFCLYVFRKVNAEAADTFIDQVVVGENLKRDDIAYNVRARLQSERSKYDKVEVLFRGWVNFRAGRSAIIRLNKTGALPDLR
jgi:hypothetical protein